MPAHRAKLPARRATSDHDGAFFDQLCAFFETYPLLGAAEEYALLVQARSTDEPVAQEARQTLLLHNMRLVLYLARRYAGPYIGLAELVDEGTLGLIEALKHAEPRRTSRLAVFAGMYIERWCKRAVTRNMQTVRLPEHVVTLRNKVNYLSTQFALEHGRYPTAAEMQSLTGESAATLDVALHAQYTAVSLESLNMWDNTAGDDDGDTLADRLPDYAPATEDVALANVERGDLYATLRRVLTDRELIVMAYRYRLGSLAEAWAEDDIMIRDEVALRLGVSCETVRKLESSALAKLRQAYGVGVERVLEGSLLA